MPSFKNVNWEKLSWIAAIELSAVMVVLALFLPGGMDIRVYYQPFARGCLDCGFVPYYVQAMLAPMLLTSWKYVWALWTLITMVGLLWVAKRTRINPLIFILTFPMIGQFWLGQIDVLLCIGALLAIREKNPYLRGLGILLLLVKPQIAILAVLYLLYREKKSEIVKVLAVPVAVFALSLLVYGWDWPLEWFANATSNIPDHIWKQASAMLWPYALILLPVPFLHFILRNGDNLLPHYLEDNFKQFMRGFEIFTR